ncbi:ATP-binding protein [Oxalobacteraceae bacterium A2-2]
MSAIQRLLQVVLDGEEDVVLVRQRARQVSSLLGFGMQDQVRIATAVSEVARCAVGRAASGHAGPRRAMFAIQPGPRGDTLSVHIRELEAGYATGSAQDEAIVTGRRLMDDCEVQRLDSGGLCIVLHKLLPPHVRIDGARLAGMSAVLVATPGNSSYAELQVQNRELVTALAELRERQDDLLALTRELEDTNRGVVALYAEIEDKAERLRKADEMKSRFLSNTSHELRTPLSSIRALAKLLLDRMDGDLSPEQERQVRYIADAAHDLSELVNDLLDLAKIEAGKVEVQVAPVNLPELFSTLKGMLRPLATNPEVELVFTPPQDTVPDTALESDEGKLTQILRNFISNALKFTERGQVRVYLADSPDPQQLRLAVSDTGIGIAPDHIALIFEEFGQVEHPLQRRAKGTGLGLPLCRKLATLLGGSVDVESRPGAGSTFFLTVPRQYQGSAAAQPET